MKLFVIVVSLLSERFLLHATAITRFDWFSMYSNWVQTILMPNSTLTVNNSKSKEISEPQLDLVSVDKGEFRNWALLVGVITPILLGIAILTWLLQPLLWGFPSLLLNILVFYYCLGPENVFYPDSSNELTTADRYLTNINTQLFAIIFWYIFLGLFGVALYRIINLSQKHTSFSHVATIAFEILDWLPSRITALLYLLAGNFQPGFRVFLSNWCDKPSDNRKFLSKYAAYALGENSEKSMIIPDADDLVSHALIIFLVLIALFTLASWL